jgi:hypothetical protein
MPETTRLTMTGMFLGTPGYLAPEVIEGTASGPAADVHSWGATVAFAATGLIDRVGRALNRYQLPLLFQQMTGAVLATGITAVLLYFGMLPAPERPSLVVAAALTVLLSGLSVVGSVRDAIDGYFLTAAGRTGEIVMFSAGLLGGVVLALGGLVVAFSESVALGDSRYAVLAAAGCALAPLGAATTPAASPVAASPSTTLLGRCIPEASPS